jgi:hypothetical protein
MRAAIKQGGRVDNWRNIAVLAIGFTLGVSLMGIQMAASRFLTPYFGSGIDIWACLISTVMLSLMAGYYVGGTLADRAPRTEVLGVSVLVAGLWLMAVPLVFEPVLDWTLTNLGDGPEAVLFGAITLIFVPLMLLSFFSPYAVRLLLNDAEHGGRVAGSVYSITTIGNIVGTLGTALFLMRFIGSRQVTYTFASVIVVCGLALIALRTKAHINAAE